MLMSPEHFSRLEWSIITGFSEKRSASVVRAKHATKEIWNRKKRKNLKFSIYTYDFHSQPVHLTIIIY
jgi:hypothetical protein